MAYKWGYYHLLTGMILLVWLIQHTFGRNTTPKKPWPRGYYKRCFFHSWLIRGIAWCVCCVTFLDNIFRPPNLGELSRLPTLAKFNSSPLKSYQNPKGKDRLPFLPFFRGNSLLNFGGLQPELRTFLPREFPY